MVLETKDIRDGAIYGEKYKDAIGELEKLVCYGSSDNFSIKGPNRGYIKKTKPSLPLFESRKQYKVKVIRQEINEDGDFILTAIIVYKPNEVKFRKKYIKIVIYRDSAKKLILQKA